MQADHIIKFHTDHPMSAPKLVGIRFIGGLNSESPASAISQENILKGVRNLRSFTGQMPTILKAKKSVAGFKLRKDSDIKVLVTIRGVLIKRKALLFNLIYTNSGTPSYLKKNLNNTGYNYNFGLTNVPQLNNTGVTIDFFINPRVQDQLRKNYYLSTLLIPLKGGPQPPVAGK